MVYRPVSGNDRDYLRDDRRKGSKEKEFYDLVSALQHGKNMGCENTGGRVDVRHCHALHHSFHDHNRQCNGKYAAHFVYLSAFRKDAAGGRRDHLADHPLGDSVLSAAVPENGIVCDAAFACGKLYRRIRSDIVKVMVLGRSGGHYVPADVSGIGNSSKRPACDGGTAHLFRRAYGNTKSARWNFVSACVVCPFLAGKQKMVQKEGGASMRAWIRAARAELVKMRHTFLYGLHIAVPVVSSLIFLLYYRAAGWGDREEIAGYIEIIGIALPFAVSLVCAGNVGLEEGNHFQTFLGSFSRKWRAFAVKWTVLWGLGIMTVAAAVFLFAAGFQWGLGKEGVFVGTYAGAAAVLCLGSMPLYLEHLFLNLVFTKSVSLSVGVAQAILSALFLTGLGDGRWQFFPCTWSARGSALFLYCMTEKGQETVRRMELGTSLAICLLLMVLLYAIIRIWFHFYEGRKCND